MLIPPMAMMAGYGAVPEDGYVIEAVKEIDFPPSLTLMVKVEPEKEPVTEDGFGGRVPSSYFWKSCLISSWRHVHWALVVIREPLRGWNGSLSVATDGGLMLPGIVGQVDGVPPPAVVVSLAGRVAGGLDIVGREVAGGVVAGGVVAGGVVPGLPLPPGIH